MPTASQRLVLVLALALCVVKGVLVAVVTPPFQTPDEYGHYDYVLYLSHIDWKRFLVGDVARPTGYNDVTTNELWAVVRATGTEGHLRGEGLTRPLPSLARQLEAGRGFTPSDSHDALSTKTVVAPQFNYPILYYGGAALLVKIVRLQTSNPVVAYYCVRLGSLLLVLLTVYWVWRTTLLLQRSSDWLPSAYAVGFVSLQPQLSMLGTSVQSDTLTVALTATAGTLSARYALRPDLRAACALGGVVGLLLLTKVHAAAAVAIATAVLIGQVRRGGACQPLPGTWCRPASSLR